MANTMMSRLRTTTKKKGNFESSQTAISYSTGFLPLDYRNGYRIDVIDDNEQQIGSYDSLGIVGGSFNTIIGKTGVAKTTLALQCSANIVRNFEDNAFVFMFDTEQSLTWTRVKNVTKFSQQELKDKFILKQGKSYMEDVFTTIMQVANEKEDNKDDYTYDTGLLDEFGVPIRTYIPTVFIIDSIPTLTSKEVDMEEQLEGSTYANRIAKNLSQMYKKLVPIVKTYNIIVFTINHITTKLEINPRAYVAPEMTYLKKDESMPGGKAPTYYANNVFKLVHAGTLTQEEDGFDGTKVRVEVVKSRTNKSGQFTNLVFDQTNGFDNIISLFKYCEDNNLLDGRNPNKYFIGRPDVKFDSRLPFYAQMATNPLLKEAVIETAIPSLKQTVSVATNRELDAANQNQADKEKEDIY